jgi:hypothetical protein
VIAHVAEDEFDPIQLVVVPHVAVAVISHIRPLAKGHRIVDDYTALYVLIAVGAITFASYSLGVVRRRNYRVLLHLRRALLSSWVVCFQSEENKKVN